MDTLWMLLVATDRGEDVAILSLVDTEAKTSRLYSAWADEALSKVGKPRGRSAQDFIHRRAFPVGWRHSTTPADIAAWAEECGVPAERAWDCTTAVLRGLQELLFEEIKDRLGSELGSQLLAVLKNCVQGTVAAARVRPEDN